jgi:hypothetical protein
MARLLAFFFVLTYSRSRIFVKVWQKDFWVFAIVDFFSFFSLIYGFLLKVIVLFISFVLLF